VSLPLELGRESGFSFLSHTPEPSVLFARFAGGSSMAANVSREATTVEGAGLQVKLGYMKRCLVYTAGKFLVMVAVSTPYAEP